MSNPSDVPQPREPGAQPPAGNVPPAGYEPPQRFPRPQGQQPAPDRQGHQKPAGFPFQRPADAPRSFNEVMPRGGLAGMFTVAGLPLELKVSYWIWLVGGMLGVLGSFFGLLATLALFTVAPGLAALLLLLVLVALALAAAQIVLALKMKDGKEWARLALTIVAAVSLVLALIGGSVGGGIGNNWLGFLISAAATVLMWLPNSQAWFTAVRGRA
ncbi:hypothetical protein PY310_05490 [Pseudarthrobacter sp. H3Y2-7]|uniref:hypothetical protein n=1 Tax=Pseudarthrobacter naphthalenicus TaxID=3031328 RepID=UPI0023AF7965|nr:hypothetical protein [Pseudarthrobacter sp. H3Y2-7]MDE8668036.1 hypothetical protein [Pseudarthrobacter sp. H3Y2-7]